MKRTVILVLAFAFLASSSFAHTHSESLPGRRLVEVKPGDVRWTTEAERNALSAKAHAEGRCGGYIDITDNQRSFDVQPMETGNYDAITLNERTTVERLLPAVDSMKLDAIIRKLSGYKNRYYQSETGVNSAGWIADQYRAIAAGRPDVKVEKVTHRFKQPSVLVTWEGTGEYKDEIVVIGGHIDSINQEAIFNKANAVAPGADDNASGTATVLETFRILVEGGFKPSRTLVFAGYAAEEIGLLGSQDIAESFRRAGKKVVGVVQFDMTAFPGANPAITFMTDYTHEKFTNFLTRVVDTYVQIPWKKDQCGYGCSDHASWDKAGYPAAMPFETRMNEMNRKIHTKNDVIDILDLMHGAQYVRLGVAYMVELSEARMQLAL